MNAPREKKTSKGTVGTAARPLPAARAIPTTPPGTAATTMRFGALLSMMLGLVHLSGWSYARIVGTGPWVLTVFGLIGGAALLSMGVLTNRRSRVAWSFLTALNGVAALVSMFGAPAIHRAFGIPLAAAFVPMVAHAVATIFLATSASELERR